MAGTCPGGAPQTAETPPPPRRGRAELSGAAPDHPQRPSVRTAGTPSPQRRALPAALGRRLVVGLVVVGLVGFTLPLVLRDGDLLAVPAVVLVVGTWLLLAVGLTLAWLLTVVLPPLATEVRTLARAAWRGIADEPSGRRAHRAVARARAWASSRLSFLEVPVEVFVARLRPRGRGLGLTLSVTVVAGAATALWWLSRQVVDVSSAVVALDQRFADVAPRLQLPELRQVMAGLTAVGVTWLIVVTVALLSGGAWWAGHRRPAVLLAATSATSGLAVTAMKATIQRSRPTLGALVETSSSFPSGHSAGGLALALGICLLVATAGAHRWPLVAAAVLPVGLLIGYSRAYLTVHWLSDVAGGWLVATTAAGLVLSVHLVVGPASSGRKRLTPLVVASVIAATVAATTGWSGASGRFPPHPSPSPERLTTTDPVVPMLVDDPFSRTLLGRPMEPVSIVVSGDGATLRSALVAAGWSVADEPTVPRLLRTYIAGARGRTDPTAPVTPTFLARRMQDLAVQEPAGAAGIRARHHARLWRLPVVLADGCQVWAATASLDDRVEWTWRTLLPNHHIAPAVDVERDRVAASLSATPAFSLVGARRLVQPTLGTNAAGDPFFTDGRVLVLDQVAPCR